MGLWHLVQASRGFNFAVTYKQNNFAWWAAMQKMDPTHVAVNMAYGAYDLRGQKLPDRPIKHKGLGGQGLYGTPGAFILNFWDFRVPMWLLRRFQTEISVLIWISAITYSALALACCAGCCVCIRRSGKRPNGVKGELDWEPLRKQFVNGRMSDTKGKSD